jgi:hypothetical protein
MIAASVFFVHLVAGSRIIFGDTPHKVLTPGSERRGIISLPVCLATQKGVYLTARAIFLSM